MGANVCFAPVGTLKQLRVRSQERLSLGAVRQKLARCRALAFVSGWPEGRAKWSFLRINFQRNSFTTANHKHVHCPFWRISAPAQNQEAFIGT